MPDITSDTYTTLIADGNYDVINLTPGRTYVVKLWGTFESTTISIQVLMPDGTWEALDDADAAGIDGTGTTEFTVIVPHTAIRFVAANTATAPAIEYHVGPKGN